MGRIKPRPTRFDMITHQMMKGCNGKLGPNGVCDTDEQIENFKNMYGDTIRYVEKTLPKSMSVGICGAIGKGILWYSLEKIKPFVERMASREYEGSGDPVHLLWEWHIRNSRKSAQAYCLTVSAIRMFVRGGKTEHHLKPALDDIFEWANDYRTMIQPRKNQFTKLSPKSKAKQTDEAINAEVDEMIGLG